MTESNLSEFDIRSSNLINRKILIIGPCGSGKTTIINDYMYHHRFDFSSVNYVHDNINENLSDCKPNSAICLLYTSPSPRDGLLSRMPSSA